MKTLASISLAALVSVCSPVYATPEGMPWVDHKKLSDAILEDPEKHTRCLALNIYWESRGESTASWVAIAFVTINRVLDPRYPESICEVVWEDKQFSWTHDGKSDVPDTSKYADRKVWEYIKEFTKGFLDNYEYIEDPTEGAVLYHRDYVEPFWRDAYEYVGTIEGHLYYRNNNYHR